MNKFPIPDNVRSFSKTFADNGFALYVVGGAVRDHLLGKPNDDYDFCTDAMPEEVMAMFPHHVVPTGIKHGTVTVMFHGEGFEVTTFRTEGEYHDGRHPDSVSFVRSLEEDLSRRDFTINAFAADCTTGAITDLFDGFNDLRKGIIRAIGDPERRFSEDALRMMRMCRFASKLGFTPDPATFKAAAGMAANIQAVSKERIFDELGKTLASGKPSTGLVLMQETGLMRQLIPEIDDCVNLAQDKVCANGLAIGNLFQHMMLAVDYAATMGYGQEVRFACLLHDIGKCRTMRRNDDGSVTFYGHETKGAAMADSVLRSLKTSNEFREKVVLLIANHMVRYESNWTDGAVKRLITRIGIENMDMFNELKWCDQFASTGTVNLGESDELMARVERLRNQPMRITDLNVDGKALFEAGIPKSKEMGTILNALLEAVVDDPSLNERNTLIDMARRMHADFSSL